MASETFKSYMHSNNDRDILALLRTSQFNACLCG